MYRKFLKAARKYRDETQGQIAVWFALIALPLLALTTYSLDYTAAITEKTDLLSSLDDASLAAVLRQNITDEERKDFAESYFKANYDSHMLAGFKVIEASSSRVEIEAVAEVPTTISASLGMETIRIRQNSVSELTQGKVVCLLILDPQGERSFEVTGGAKLKAKDCSVQVNSMLKRAAIVEHGGVANSKGFCVAGGAVGNYTLFVNTECSVVADPYKNTITPKPGPCVSQAEIQKTLSDPKADYRGVDFYPGTYCGGLKLGEGNDRKVVNLKPGTYIIKDGPLSLDYGSVLYAKGVTFVMSGKDAVIKINEGSHFFVDAPKTGPLAGLAFIQDVSADRRATGHFPDGESYFRRGSNIQIVGTAYLPTQKISFAGGSIYSSQAPATSFIGYNISISDGSYIGIAVDHEKAGLPPIQPRADEGARLSR